MAEPFNPDRLLRPGALVKMSTFEEGRELAEKLITALDADVIGDVMQHACDDSNRAHAVMFYLLCKLRGWPIESGVSIVAEYG